MTAKTIETFKQFATRLGVRPSYITQLRKDGRLVLSEDGRAVNVEASLERIEATKDPARRSKIKDAEEQPPKQPADEGEPPVDQNFQSARARTEHYKSLQTKIDYEKAAGVLVEADAVRAAGAELGQMLRTTLERFPDEIAPALIGLEDEARIRAVIVEHVERLLSDISLAVSSAIPQSPSDQRTGVIK